ncbi:MAG: phosphotransferase [Candidatus Cloacimonetes bacterium]|nr:phosphotransferase [Candidatus Cloacimonadota bacterium]
MKSNLIFQKEDGRVIKICNSPSEFKSELAIYRRQLPFTPQLLDDDGRITLVLEYIEGMHIGEMPQPDFGKIAQLFAALHQLENHHGKVICHYDTNPRNYLFSPGKNRYFMLDFAEWRYDFPESDIIHFLLFFASIYSHRHFCEIFRQLITAYRQTMPINPIEWDILLPEIIQRFDTRRALFGKREQQKNPDVLHNRDFMYSL